MSTITKISAAQGIDLAFKDGTSYLLRKNRFPAATSAADLEQKLQALIDQYVNSKLLRRNTLRVHVYTLSPVRIGLGLFSTRVPDNWWVEHG